MTIVASNSLTLSKVSDGTITHTAWSYSADGTDRFTTVYPNLNLLEGSKKYTKEHPKTVSSSATDGAFAVNDVFVKNLKAGTYTMSGKSDAPWTIHATNDANRKGKVGLWLASTTPGLNVNISLGDTVPKTIEVPKDGDYCVRINTYSNGTDVVTHSFWDFKLELGSTATPYMQSASEVTTADWPKYIGHYTDFTQADSTNPSDYTWGPMRGDDGVGIKTTVITYAISTSGTTAPTSGWTSTVPTVAAGSYLWTKTVWAYTDNTSETGYSVGKMGNTGPAGPAGSDGNPGKIVSNTEPTTRFKGLTWKYSGTSDLTASDGTVILSGTEYYWSGTNWILNEINAHNINGNNLTITDGEFVSTTTNGLVITSTEIKDNHIAISKTDGTVNTRNDIALDSEQGLAQK
ncbi:hypothetical protein EFN85_11840, partial [Lactococcus lactis]|nr:hypothetical protein [Lactococcus lactis]